MKLDHATAEKYLGTLLMIVHAIDELAHDKLLPAELALGGIKAALESLDQHKITHADPEDIRAMAARLRSDIADRNAAKDEKLKDKFDTSDEDVKP